jgi:hypothetical protein
MVSRSRDRGTRPRDRVCAAPVPRGSAGGQQRRRNQALGRGLRCPPDSGQLGIGHAASAAADRKADVRCHVVPPFLTAVCPAAGGVPPVAAAGQGKGPRANAAALSRPYHISPTARTRGAACPDTIASPKRQSPQPLSRRLQQPTRRLQAASRNLTSRYRCRTVCRPISGLAEADEILSRPAPVISLNFSRAAMCQPGPLERVKGERRSRYNMLAKRIEAGAAAS